MERRMGAFFWVLKSCKPQTLNPRPKFYGVGFGIELWNPIVALYNSQQYSSETSRLGLLAVDRMESHMEHAS